VARRLASASSGSPPRGRVDELHPGADPLSVTQRITDKFDSRSSSLASLFEPVRWGVDDITVGMQLDNESSIMAEMAPGREPYQGTKILGHYGEFDKFYNLLGRHRVEYKTNTRRLYVQARLAAPGDLTPVDALMDRFYSQIFEPLTQVNIVPSTEMWVTRLDVSVDGRCKPEDGRLLLDGLSGSRLPHGWISEVLGEPPSTVNFRTRGKKSNVVACSYCRNLKTGEGEPFGLIRLEARERYVAQAKPLSEVVVPGYARTLWESRYCNLMGRVKRIPREVQVVNLYEMLESGDITFSQMSQIHTFLDLERLGLAKTAVNERMYYRLKRMCRDHGIAANANEQELDICLSEMVKSYREAWNE